MLVKLQCPSCSAKCSGNIPDGTKKLKCPKCRSLIDLPPPAEEEPIEITPIAEAPPMVLAVPDEPPTVLAAPEDEAEEEPVKRKKRDWELLKPRTFGLYSRSIMGGLVYDICDGDSDDVLGRATEKVTAGKTLAGFLVGRQMMEGTIAVSDDETGKPVLLIERTNFNHSILGATPCKVKLRDHHDELLARFELGEKMWGGIALNFDADCTIINADKDEWAVAEGLKNRTPDYVFLDPDGKKLARVRGKGTTKGFMAASSSWTGKGGWLKISISDGFDATPAEKLIILGTAIAIEFIVTTIGETKPGTIRLG